MKRHYKRYIRKEKDTYISGILQLSTRIFVFCINRPVQIYLLKHFCHFVLPFLFLYLWKEIKMENYFAVFSILADFPTLYAIPTCHFNLDIETRYIEKINICLLICLCYICSCILKNKCSKLSLTLTNLGSMLSGSIKQEKIKMK